VDRERDSESERRQDPEPPVVRLAVEEMDSGKLEMKTAAR
jgi:hypothetical protein